MKYKLYHGSSPYLSLNAVHTHIKEIQEETTTIQTIEADTTDFKIIFDTISSPSLFSPKRILFIKRIYKNKQKTELIDKILELIQTQENKDQIIFWEDQKIKSNTKYYKFFKKDNNVEEIELLNKRTFITWLRDELEKNNLKIDPTVIKELAERTNYDPERCANEIKKFRLQGEKRIIEKEDIETFTADTLEKDIWDLIEAINIEEKAKTMKILEKLKTQSIDPNYILSMLARNLRLLTLTKDLSEKKKNYKEISSILKIPPFTTPTLIRSSSKYSKEKIKILYSKLTNLDYQIKTGKIDGHLGLTLICPYL